MLRRVLAKSQAGWGTSVTGPKLYTWYSPDEAISFFGASDGAQSYCNGQWRVFPAALVCLTEIDENDPRREATKSHFVDASRFCWVADQPYRGPDGEPRYFVPPEAIAGDTRVIELFVRPPDARQYLYAGQLARSYMQQFPGGEGAASASFRLQQTLPSRVWLELGGLRLGDTDHASVDLALDRLRQPTTVHDRLGVLRQLVNYWHGPIRPEDGMSDADLGGLPLPMPLRWWYSWAGKRSEILGRQNRLLVPRDFERRYNMLRINNGRLCFYDENQGVYQWATERPQGPVPTLGQLRESTIWFWLWCERCQHQVDISRRSLGRWCMSLRTSASAASVITFGITSGRGSRRDQSGRLAIEAAVSGGAAC
jgi:hypothetical protein